MSPARKSELNELRLDFATWTGPAGPGDVQRQVDFLDFMVDDQSVLDWIRWCSDDPESEATIRTRYVTPFARTLPTAARRSAHRRLLLRDPPDVDARWTSLYVCPLCGDLGCGAVAVEVARSADTVEWRALTRVGSFPDETEPLSVGPFVFDRIAYTDALVSALSL